MKKNLLILVSLLLFPLSSLAASVVFDHDLYFGLKNDDSVVMLQKFLQEQHMYKGPANGNFFGLTQSAVKIFQERNGISATGYFGPKTRAQANDIFSSKTGASKEGKSAQIAKLISQIQELQLQLRTLQEMENKKQEAISTAPTAPPAPMPPPAAPPAATTTPATTTPVVVIPNAAIISGESTTTFPATATNPLKIGDIVIRNGTNQPLLFSQLVLDIQDSMNSPLNRGKSVNLLLRYGSTTAEEVAEKKAFTFNSSDPQLQETRMHRNQLNFSYPVLFAAGETKSASLWIENFDYVISGTLKFSLYDIQTTRVVDKSGIFSFVLTK